MIYRINSIVKFLLLSRRIHILIFHYSLVFVCKTYIDQWFWVWWFNFIFFSVNSAHFVLIFGSGFNNNIHVVSIDWTWVTWYFQNFLMNLCALIIKQLMWISCPSLWFYYQTTSIYYFIIIFTYLYTGYSPFWFPTYSPKCLPCPVQFPIW